jgi:hypothetical protein
MHFMAKDFIDAVLESLALEDESGRFFSKTITTSSEVAAENPSENPSEHPSA